MTLLIPPSAPLPDRSPGHEAWRPRSDADLVVAQLRALDQWHRLFGSGLTVVPGQTREARLDGSRQRDVVERERRAIHRWAEAGLRDDYPFARGGTPRAVIAHRSEWVRDKVAEGFRAADLEVIAAVDDGAEAAAAIVLEQPDLVFVEDLLPSLSGIEVISRTRLLAPDAMIGAHALGQTGMPPLLDAGARATFSRRIPPAEIAAELVACLHGRHSVLTLV
jgi:CheY-like chemotaxis protein